MTPVDSFLVTELGSNRRPLKPYKPQKPKKPKLKLYEWFLVVSLAVLVVVGGGSFLYGKWKDRDGVGTPGFLASQFIEVNIKGAVDIPGTYLLPKGADLTRLLELARVKREADIQGIKITGALKDKQKIIVPSRPVIIVYLQGAVEQTGPVIMPKGAKVTELLESVSMHPLADRTVFQQDRKLKNKEVFLVPYKDLVEKSIVFHPTL